jgi:hypothetical protein
MSAGRDDPQNPASSPKVRSVFSPASAEFGGRRFPWGKDLLVALLLFHSFTLSTLDFSADGTVDKRSPRARLASRSSYH